MPYTGMDPDLVDLQNQITANLNSTNSAINSIKTQIKQVTLSLEGSLNKTTAAFVTLKAYVISRLGS